MPDALGWRMKFGVVAPSTNTAVQPEFDMMRPRGVTNHFARIHIPNDPIRGDADFEKLIAAVRDELSAAVDRVMTCEPQHLIMGMSSETFWDGLDGSERLRQRIEAQAGVAVTMGSDAARQALRRLNPELRRLGVVTPYMPVADEQVRRFFTDCGYEVRRLVGLKCASPVLIAHVGEAELREAVAAADGPEVEAIVQVGTNLAFARLAAGAELWCAKPVVAINTATYWWALRRNGIADPVDGFGALLREY
jgi:maleate isomerase